MPPKVKENQPGVQLDQESQNKPKPNHISKTVEDQLKLKTQTKSISDVDDILIILVNTDVGMRFHYSSSTCFCQAGIDDIIDTYSMKTYVLLYFKNKNDVIIIVKLLFII